MGAGRTGADTDRTREVAAEGAVGFLRIGRWQPRLWPVPFLSLPQGPGAREKVEGGKGREGRCGMTRSADDRALGRGERWMLGRLFLASSLHDELYKEPSRTECLFSPPPPEPGGSGQGLGGARQGVADGESARGNL